MRNRPRHHPRSADHDGHRPLTCTFFNQAWRERELLPGRRGMFAGKGQCFPWQPATAHPEYELLDEDSDESTVEEFANALIPVYPAASGLPTWSIRRCVLQVLDVWDGHRGPLPGALRRERKLAGLRNRCGASTNRPISRYRTGGHRLKWDEALAVQLVLAQRRRSAGHRPAPACPPVDGGLLDLFDAKLPFTLTQGQQEVGAAITTDLSGVHPMNRLLQGEVGSGKTLVALRAMLQVVDAGRQAALLAPTEVLAAQHVARWPNCWATWPWPRTGRRRERHPDHVLTGSLNTAQRRQAMLDTASGAAGIVVGTHGPDPGQVSFADLGFVVVDEQHRFGVEQRTRCHQGRCRHQPARARHDGDADPAHGRDDRLRRPGDVIAARTAGRPLADHHIRGAGGGETGLAGPGRGADHRGGPRRTPGIRCVPPDRRGGRAGEDVDGPPPSDSDTDRRSPLAVLDVAPALVEGPLHGLRVAIPARPPARRREGPP